MAVSGNQLTRVGAFLSGVAKKLTILAKAAGVTPPEGSVSSKFRINFPPQDRNVAFAFEDRAIIFPYENRETKI